MKLITDVHNHSDFSFDGQAPLAVMLRSAMEKGVGFYGNAEHFDYELEEEVRRKNNQTIDERAYFHTARRLQEDYAGVMNVLVGAEFGYGEKEETWEKYAAVCEKYEPDFVVNSVHCFRGDDYYFKTPFYKDGVLIDKKETFGQYIALVRKSLDVPYPYDVVGHFGYVSRYAPYADKRLLLSEFQEEIDELLVAVIEKGKILEVNTSSNGLDEPTVTPRRILRRYYELGGRQISFASDAHDKDTILRSRDRAITLLKEIGFTYITVPCRGEYIKVEM